MVKIFFKKIFILVGSGVVSAILLSQVFLPLMRDENSYLSATIDKEKMLDSIPSPRIVFVGVSNLAFGLNSKRISDSLGLPVINMGLHGGLGLDFILREAQAGLKKNDIVVICPLYHLKKNGNLEVKASALQSNPATLHYLENSPFGYTRLYFLKLQESIIYPFYYFMKNTVNKSPEKIYLRSSFNSNGDIISHHSDTSKHHIDLVSNYHFQNSEEIDEINKFVISAESKGATAFYLFPNAPQSLFEIQKPKFIKFENDINSQLKCRILNNTQTLIFPDSLCYDTMFHLNKTGKDSMTNIIIKILHPFVSKTDSIPANLTIESRDTSI
jgi:hypothetical protein